MSRNDSSALIGQTIAGKFAVEALIAVGGSGTVYRARHLALERTVALKVLRQEFARDHGFVERFKREARAASRLDHPNSVRVLDFGQHDDELIYLAMEYVEGRNLYQVIREEWPLSDQRMVDILSQVLSAVGVAHEMGVIHRDLKPENIMIIAGRGEEGEHAETAKVCDFGIATLGTRARGEGSLAAEGPRVTGRGVLVGTPQYMSPEQARGEPADRRGDLYSAGVVLYQMLTRRLPFDGESVLMVAVKHVTEAPAPPSRFARVNPRLEAICLKALSKSPDERFASAREMRAALRASLAPAFAPGAGVIWTPPEAFASDTLAGTSAGRAIGVPRWRRSALVAGVSLSLLLAGALASRALFRSHPRSALPSLPFAVAPRSVSHSRPVASRTEPASRPAEIPGVVEGDGVSVEAPPASPPVLRARVQTPRQKSESSRRPGPLRSIAGGSRGQPRASTGAAAPELTKTAEASTAPPRSLPLAQPADLDRATVSITGVTTSSAIPGSNIRAAIGRTPILRCYRDALRAHGSAATGTAALSLRIDSAGYVTSATLKDAQFLPAVKTCVERAALAAKIKDVDTGEATADLTLTFVCPS